jgi:hypothetical protein
MRTILLLSSIIFFASCSKENSDTRLIRVDDQWATKSDYAIFLKQQPQPVDMAALPEKSKQALFDRFSENILLAHLAADTGLAEQAAFPSRLKREENSLLARLLIWRTMLDSLYTDNYIRAFRKRMYTKLEVRQILIGYSGARNSSVNRSEAEAEALCEELYKLVLANPERFSEIAVEKSEGQQSKKGGRLPAFSAGQMPEVAENVAYSLTPGEISAPFRSEYGYHIFMLDKSTDNRPEYVSPVLEDEEVYRRMLGGRERLWNPIFERQSRRLRNQVGVLFHKENIAYASSEFARFFASGSTPDIHALNPFDAGSKVLIQLDSTNYTIADMFADIGRNLRQAARVLRSEEELMRMLERPANIIAWANMARKNGLENDPWYLAMRHQFIWKNLSEAYKQAYIEPNSDPTESDLRSFYDRNIDRYTRPERMEIFLVRQDDIEMAAEALRDAMSGKEWGGIVRKYSQASEAELEKAGNIGLQTENGYGEVARRAFAAGPNRLVEELVLNNNTFYIVKTGDKVAEEIRPYDTVRRDIIGAAKLRNQHLLTRDKIDAALAAGRIELRPEVLGLE